MTDAVLIVAGWLGLVVAWAYIFADVGGEE